MKCELTDENRKALEGLFPVSGEKVDYIPEYYEKHGVPEEYRPTFTIRPYNSEEKSRFKKIQSKAMAMASKAYKEMPKDKELTTNEIGLLVFEALDQEEIKSLCRGCIVGSKNFLDSELKEIPYKGDKNGMDKKQFNLLHSSVIDELSGYVNKISGLVESEVLSLK